MDDRQQRLFNLSLALGAVAEELRALVLESCEDAELREIVTTTTQNTRALVSITTKLLSAHELITSGLVQQPDYKPPLDLEDCPRCNRLRVK